MSRQGMGETNAVWGKPGGKKGVEWVVVQQKRPFAGYGKRAIGESEVSHQNV
jgi:hypothetical protein